MSKIKLTQAQRFIIGVICLLMIVAVAIGILPMLRSYMATKSEAQKVPVAQFVTRSGTQLMLDKHPFRFAGANMHWLALEDSGNYASPFSVKDGFATAKAMNFTVIRSHSLGISVGCSNCVEPSEGNFNQMAFKHIDYALMVARQFGIHLIIPLTDNYHYTTGGKHTFTDWVGARDENQFYTNSNAVAAFEFYINTLLNHVNSYTGQAYKDDATIMAWETGNELAPPTTWTQTISTYIKSIDAKHLIIDGRRGIDPQAATLTNVDILSDHYYPMSVAKLTNDVNIAKDSRKAFIAGEYQWNDSRGGDPLPAFLAASLSNTAIAGDMLWELWPHNEQYGYNSNQPEFTLHYPGDDSTMQNQINLLRDHAYKMVDLPVPAADLPNGPQLTTVVRAGARNIIIWQGAVGAANYSIERSSTGAGGPWDTICDHCVTDMTSPWIDNSPLTAASWYRIVPYNTAGVAGTTSNVFQASVTKTTIDDLNDWSLTYAHSDDLLFSHDNSNFMSGDSSVVIRKKLAASYIIWKQHSMSSFQMISYVWPHDLKGQFSIYSSLDGKTWSLQMPVVSTIRVDWPERIYSLYGLTNTSYVKVVWDANNVQPWTPALGQVSISYN
ncbi:MAG: hypothetical protein PVS3B1_01820 [Ktedonobacteraceae bacterium]